MAQHKPKAGAIMRYGTEIATLKANTKPKQWKRFVKFAHKQGHTVAGQLSGAPAPLMERTPSSIRKQAVKTVGRAYKPVYKDLSQQEAATKFLATKRADDDASYRTWLLGETDKLAAQSRAADATLNSQQQSIAQDLNANQAAAKADSLQRMAGAAGNVSNPQQSAALDTSAADARSAALVASGREQTAALDKIGEDAQTMTRGAMLATAAVAAATHQADTYKTQAQIAADRFAAKQAQAKDTEGLTQDLRNANVTNAQNTREFGLAQGELHAKQKSLAEQVREANQKYRLDHAKFKLDKWKARHADAVANAKIKLGYDQIKATKGQKAADRALNKWLTKYREGQANTRNDADNATSRANNKDSNKAGADGKKGVTQDERDLFRKVETARGLITRAITKGRTAEQYQQGLRKAGYDDATIALADALVMNNGRLPANMRGPAKRIGILHPNYFWKPPRTSGGGRPDTAGNPNVG